MNNRTLKESRQKRAFFKWPGQQGMRGFGLATEEKAFFFKEEISQEYLF